MWQLSKYLSPNETSSDQMVFYLLEGRQYVIGRKDCDIVLPGDASISRKHATMKILQSPKDGGKQVIIVDTSKIGVFVNGKKISPKQEVTVNSGDVISFGKMMKLKLEYIPFNVVLSCINKSEEKTNIKNLLAKLGGKCFSEWNDDITYLIMQKITFTFKVVCALASGAPIVTMKYFEDVLDNCDQKKGCGLPIANDYLPPVGEASLVGKEYLLQCNEKRRCLFQGKTFVSLHAKQFKSVKPAVQLAGGTIVLCDKKDDKLFKKISTNQLLVMFVENKYLKISNGEQKTWIEEVYSKVKSANLRAIRESEIGLAILNNTIQEFCNPTTKAAPALTDTTHSQVLQDTMAIDTQQLTQQPLPQQPLPPQPLPNQFKVPETVDLSQFNDTNTSASDVEQSSFKRKRETVVDLTLPSQQKKKTKVDLTSPMQQQKKLKVNLTSPSQQQKKAKVELTSPRQQQKKAKVELTSPRQQQKKAKVEDEINLDDDEEALMKSLIEDDAFEMDSKVSIEIPLRNKNELNSSIRNNDTQSKVNSIFQSECSSNPSIVYNKPKSSLFVNDTILSTGMNTKQSTGLSENSKKIIQDSCPMFDHDDDIEDDNNPFNFDVPTPSGLLGTSTISKLVKNVISDSQGNSPNSLNIDEIQNDNNINNIKTEENFEDSTFKNNSKTKVNKEKSQQRLVGACTQDSVREEIVLSDDEDLITACEKKNNRKKEKHLKSEDFSYLVDDGDEALVSEEFLPNKKAKVKLTLNGFISMENKKSSVTVAKVDPDLDNLEEDLVRTEYVSLVKENTTRIQKSSAPAKKNVKNFKCFKKQLYAGRSSHRKITRNDLIVFESNNDQREALFEEFREEIEEEEEDQRNADQMFNWQSLDV